MCFNIGQTHDKMSCKKLVKNVYLKDAQQRKMKGAVCVIQHSWEITKKKTLEKPMVHACSGPQDQ